MEWRKNEINEEAMELARLESDRERYKNELNVEKEKIAYLLKNGMGDDMKEIVSGKKKIRISFWRQLKFKINCFLDNLFNIF